MRPAGIDQHESPNDTASSKTWDHGTHDEFYEYYANESLSPRTRERFRRIRDTVLRAIPRSHQKKVYAIADVGCGPGVQSFLWAELGHEVHGIDVNARLLELSRQRAAKAGYEIEFQLGSAVSLPWTDRSMDVCLVVELLEHVSDWKICLNEFARVLRPGGVLLLTTSNSLCPVQHEFNLPLYSWYPARLKRYCEQLARTSRPSLTNYATYPAVNWFTIYQLSRELNGLGFDSMDRFDLLDTSGKGAVARIVITSIRKIRVFRWLAHVATPGAIVLAIKRS